MLRAFLLAIVLLLSATSSYAELPTWPMDSYSYYANNSSLKQIIRDFATGFGLSTKISTKVHGVLSGRIVAKNPTDFMNRMASMFGLHWFTHAGTLYVSAADEAVSRSIRVPTATLPQIRAALIDLGILDPRFGWGELTGENIIMISGPPAYTELVLSTIRQLPIIAGGMKVAVFRIRHASVVDRTINFRGQSISTPGLATILQTLLMGKDIPNLSVETNQHLKSLSSGLRQPSSTPNAEVKTGDTNGAGPLQPNSDGKSGKVDSAHLQSLPTKNYAGPTIEADPRLNAIIIKDIPERLGIYRHLIDELDIPTALVEIEAMIIDVNTSKLQDLGINWGAAFHGGQYGIGFGDPSDTSNGNALSFGFAQNGTVSPNTLLVNATNYFISRLHMMENNGDARIQSRPSILTEENRGAVLDFSETFYIRSIGERVANVQPVTVGTSLRVTPRVLLEKNGKQGIMLSIDIEDGQIEEQRRINDMPTVRESTISTEALVQQNQSLLIGGYNHDENTATVARVPVLGHLPIIGLLFSKKSTSIQRRERLFMIRPHIVYLPWQHPEDGQDMANQEGTAPADGVQPGLPKTMANDAEVHIVQIQTTPQHSRPADWAQKALPSSNKPVTPSLSFDPKKNWQPPVPPRQPKHPIVDVNAHKLRFPQYSAHDYSYTPPTDPQGPQPTRGTPKPRVIPTSQSHVSITPVFSTPPAPKPMTSQTEHSSRRAVTERPAPMPVEADMISEETTDNARPSFVVRKPAPAIRAAHHHQPIRPITSTIQFHHVVPISVKPRQDLHFDMSSRPQAIVISHERMPAEHIHHVIPISVRPQEPARPTDEDHNLTFPDHPVTIRYMPPHSVTPGIRQSTEKSQAQAHSPLSFGPLPVPTHPHPLSHQASPASLDHAKAQLIFPAMAKKKASIPEKQTPTELHF